MTSSQSENQGSGPMATSASAYADGIRGNRSTWGKDSTWEITPIRSSHRRSSALRCFRLREFLAIMSEPDASSLRHLSDVRKSFSASTRFVTTITIIEHHLGDRPSSSFFRALCGGRFPGTRASPIAPRNSVHPCRYPSRCLPLEEIKQAIRYRHAEEIRESPSGIPCLKAAPANFCRPRYRCLIE